MSTILFFLGILMAVAVLSEVGVLTSFGQWLEHATNGNAYFVTGAIGVVSSIVDNVPLVAGCMGMYNVIPAAAVTSPDMMMFVQDGQFWQLLAYCAGVGGSMLIIGSAAGVVVMGLEKSHSAGIYATFRLYVCSVIWEVSWSTGLSGCLSSADLKLIDMYVRRRDIVRCPAVCA